LIDAVNQIDRRLVDLEKNVDEIKQKISDVSFKNTVNMAMEGLQAKVDELKTLVESQRHSDYSQQDYKVNIKCCNMHSYV